MGCFNKIGFYSKLPIKYGDKIVIFLCLTLKNAARNGSNPIYIDEIIQPLSLPIFCEYDEYGKGENYEKDANVKLIEQIFETDIESLISVLNDTIYSYSPDTEYEIDKTLNRFLERNNLKEYGIFYTMERRDVFDKMIEISDKPFYQIGNYNNGTYIGDYWLNKLGFVCVEKHSEKFHYGNIYKLKDKDCDYFVASNGHSPEICKGLIQIDIAFGGIKDFIDKWEHITGIPLQYDKSIETINRIDISYDISLEAYKQYIKEDEEIKDIISNNMEDLTERMGKEFISTYLRFREKMKNYKENSIFFTDKIYEAKTIYNDIWNFSTHMCLHMEDLSLSLYKRLSLEQLQELKPIACQLAKFNKTLSNLCGSYEFSYYGHQEVCYSPYIEEFDELHKFYGSIINQMIERNNDVD